MHFGRRPAEFGSLSVIDIVVRYRCAVVSSDPSRLTYESDAVGRFLGLPTPESGRDVKDAGTAARDVAIGQSGGPGRRYTWLRVSAVLKDQQFERSNTGMINTDFRSCLHTQ